MLGKKAQVFSLNPGVIMTPLGAHVDWASEFGDISKLFTNVKALIRLLTHDPSSNRFRAR